MEKKRGRNAERMGRLIVKAHTVAVEDDKSDNRSGKEGMGKDRRWDKTTDKDKCQAALSYIRYTG